MSLRVASYRIASVLAMTLPMTAHASDHWGGSVAAVSDYTYRGISQTRGAAALQAGAYRAFGEDWSFGVWVSSVDLGWIDASYELDATLTRSWLLGEHWSAQVSYTHYFYPRERRDYDYDELAASLTYRDRITATVALIPNASLYGQGAMAWKKRAASYELAMLQPLGERWSFIAGAGHYDLHEAFRTGYWFWSTGFAFTWQAVQLELVRIDTDDAAVRLFGYQRAGSRWSAGLTWKF
jgi:uncharacterized protein (TIGR02001 family)